MKKKSLFSLVLASLFFLSGCVMSGTRPHGHKYYVKHSKHHKQHKLHKHHGLIDATYQN